MLKILFYDAKSYDKDSLNRELANSRRFRSII